MPTNVVTGQGNKAYWDQWAFHILDTLCDRKMIRIGAEARVAELLSAAGQNYYALLVQAESIPRMPSEEQRRRAVDSKMIRQHIRLVDDLSENCESTAKEPWSQEHLKYFQQVIFGRNDEKLPPNFLIMGKLVRAVLDKYTQDCQPAKPAHIPPPRMLFGQCKTPDQLIGYLYEFDMYLNSSLTNPPPAYGR